MFKKPGKRSILSCKVLFHVPSIPPNLAVDDVVVEGVPSVQEPCT